MILLTIFVLVPSDLGILKEDVANVDSGSCLLNEEDENLGFTKDEGSREE